MPRYIFNVLGRFAVQVAMPNKVKLRGISKKTGKKNALAQNKALFLHE